MTLPFINGPEAIVTQLWRHR